LIQAPTLRWKMVAPASKTPHGPPDNTPHTLGLTENMNARQLAQPKATTLMGWGCSPAPHRRFPCGRWEDEGGSATTKKITTKKIGWIQNNLPTRKELRPYDQGSFGPAEAIVTTELVLHLECLR